MPSPMEHVCLRALAELSEATGAQIVAQADGAILSGSVYHTLLRMERHGLVLSRLSEERSAATGKNVRLYALTARGRAVAKQWRELLSEEKSA